MREKTGQIFENKKNGLWTARVCYKNTNGKKTAIQRTAENKADELQKLWQNSDQKADSLVFNFKDVRNSFESACKEAGIETGRSYGITPHSLRNCAAFRLVNGQMPIQMIGRILGCVDIII